MITSINEFRAILEAKQTEKDIWWDKNYQALIDYASDLDHDSWASIIGEGDDDDDLQETVDAIMDQTGKHKALDLLYRCSIDELDDMIGANIIDENIKYDADVINKISTLLHTADFDNVFNMADDMFMGDDLWNVDKNNMSEDEIIDSWVMDKFKEDNISWDEFVKIWDVYSEDALVSEKKKKSKVSKAARKFISDKIEFLISKEGKPRKQAVAMAYSYAEREGLIKESTTKAGDFQIISPITSVKNKEGVLFNVGDMVRIKNYHPDYVAITEFKLGTAGNLLVLLDTYDLQQDINELEHQPTA